MIKRGREIIDKKINNNENKLDQFYTNPDIAIKCLNILNEKINTKNYDIHMEPSAGNGVFYNIMNKAKRYGIDIEPKHKDIVKQDFLEFKPNHDKKYIIIGNETYTNNHEIAKIAYKTAINLYKGSYLPNRIYEDWTSEEREKTQLLILGAYITLAEILIDENPLESIRLAQKALAIDAAWEDAYRIQMKAYIVKGNRPQAIKTYMKCEVILEEEYGISPLPETKKLLKHIEAIQ